jgi:hydrogenase maturation protease
MLLVIGYGNTLRGDDAIGPLAVQELEDENEFSDVEFLTCHQLAPEVAEHLSRAGAVLFIDASAAAPTGAIECREIVPAQAVPGSITFRRIFC